jgi:NAD(P)-dependent dehydrogenase (short-subunit alcohol dehydrogenase family)
MSLMDAFGYNGKRALVVGGATGMGAAVADLVREAGAEVVVMDRASVSLDGVKSIHVDLSDQASIDAAVDECGGPVHALFSCAGVADGTPALERINFIGHRHMIDRMRGAGMLPRGSAIGFISSAAGAAWLPNMEMLNRYLDITDFDEAARFAVDNNIADYMWSKRAICAYVAREALALLKEGIRINAILPGPTDTPLARANADLWLGFGADYRGEAGIEASTPLEQAYALAFLCSDAAVAVTGITMVTDAGYFASGLSGSFPSATAIAQFLTTGEFPSG